MKAGHNHGEFLVEDPQWAIDFAPNGGWENPQLFTYSDLC
jgi:hypothetical protein